MSLSKFLQTILIITAGVIFIFFVSWHWKLGLIRYFDVDEFAHLHWTSHMLMGNRPYIDFLSFFPPGFWIFLSPVFVKGWGTVQPILSARILMFFIFLGNAAAAGFLFYILRKNSFAIFPALLFAFLPLPMDKIIEIRPDNLATLLLLAGLILQVQRRALWSGVCYGLSLLVLTKIAPTVIFAFLVLFFLERRRVPSFLLGLALPLSVFGVWAISTGHFSTIWYSLVNLPLEANKLANIFFMGPDLFFYPNNIYYGQGGVNTGLIVNHALWLFGIGIGAYRLLQFSREELLPAGIFILNVALYVLYIPLKHAQYLIPIALFVALYGADGLLLIWKKLSRHPLGAVSGFALFLMGLIGLYQTFLLVNKPKLSWTNVEMLSNLEKVWQTVPKNEYILDLDGSTLYYPDPYYACCLPFGQWQGFLSQPLPSLSKALETTKTKYIFQGSLKRVTTLQPTDQAYITDHYTISSMGGELLWMSP